MIPPTVLPLRATPVDSQRTALASQLAREVPGRKALMANRPLNGTRARSLASVDAGLDRRPFRQNRSDLGSLRLGTAVKAQQFERCNASAVQRTAGSGQRPE